MVEVLPASTVPAIHSRFCFGTQNDVSLSSGSRDAKPLLHLKPDGQSELLMQVLEQNPSEPRYERHQWWIQSFAISLYAILLEQETGALGSVHFLPISSSEQATTLNTIIIKIISIIIATVRFISILQKGELLLQHLVE